MNDQFYDVDIHKDCCPECHMAWKNIQSGFIGNGIEKKIGQLNWLTFLRDYIHSELRGMVPKAESSKIICSIYEDRSGHSRLVIGFDLYPGQTYDIMVKLRNTNDKL